MRRLFQLLSWLCLDWLWCDHTLILTTHPHVHLHLLNLCTSFYLLADFLNLLSSLSLNGLLTLRMSVWKKSVLLLGTELEEFSCCQGVCTPSHVTCKDIKDHKGNLIWCRCSLAESYGRMTFVRNRSVVFFISPMVWRMLYVKTIKDCLGRMASLSVQWK